LARDRLGQQRLAAARRPDEQDAARDATAETREAARVLEELDHLLDLVLRLVAARDVVEGDVGVVLLGVELRARAAEAHHATGGTLAAHLAQEEEEEDQDQEPRTPEQEEALPERALVLVLRALAGRDVEVQRGELRAHAGERRDQRARVLDALDLVPDL